MASRSRVTGGEPRGVVFQLPDGVPAHVLAAFQANASDDPEEVKAAKQRLRERNGADYRFDPETKLFERLPAVVHAPPRRENAAPAVRPRERRPATRRRARAPTGDDEPSPRPDLALGGPA